MRKILLSLAALIMGTGLATMVATESAQAAPTTSKVSGGNCIDQREKSNLRLGWTTGQVNTYTKSHPWFHENETIDGTRYAVYVYNDCRVNSGKVVGVVYRVAWDGTQHYALSRYVAL
jgi:hypothetical protein